MSELFNKLHHKIDIIHKYNPSNAKKLLESYDVEHPSEEDLISAKKLHCTVYLERRFITHEQTDNGVISVQHDPYQLHSTYFVVKAKTDGAYHKKGEVVAVARQIEATEEKGLEALPIMHNIALHRRHKIHRPSELVELSAFVKKKGVDSNVLLLLFRSMFEHSNLKGHKLWYMACDEKVYWRLKTLFPYAIRRIGPRTYYMGSYVIPAAVNIRLVQKNLALAYYLSPPPFRRLRKGLKEVLLTQTDKK